MFQLSRTVRFSCNQPVQGPNILPSSGENGFGGIPPLRGLGRFEEFVVRCTGPLDPVVNYLVDIKDVDRAVRAVVLPKVTAAFLRGFLAPVDPVAVLAECLHPLADALHGRLASLLWNLSPTLSLEIAVPDPAVVLFRQKFEFAASHRLHAPSLSPEENRRAFGKCNHENGHGHNYIFEPCVELPVAPLPHPLGVGGLEAIARRVILDRYDHKYLNVDTPEFDPARGGVVPSVENIARVFFERLAPEVAAAAARLARVTVWESERTAASYPG